MTIIIPTLPSAPAPDAPLPDRMRYAELATQHALLQATLALAESQAGMLTVAQAQLQHGQRLADLFSGAAAAAGAPVGTEGARTVVAALLGETARPPAEVAQSVQARLSAVDTMLGAAPGTGTPEGAA